MNLHVTYESVCSDGLWDGENGLTCDTGFTQSKLLNVRSCYAARSAYTCESKASLPYPTTLTTVTDDGD
ncbi:unnamed protein product, partial [Nesidiocoris tenuis]